VIGSVFTVKAVEVERVPIAHVVQVRLSVPLFVSDPPPPKGAAVVIVMDAL